MKFAKGVGYVCEILVAVVAYIWFISNFFTINDIGYGCKMILSQTIMISYINIIHRSYYKIVKHIMNDTLLYTTGIVLDDFLYFFIVYGLPLISV